MFSVRWRSIQRKLPAASADDSAAMVVVARGLASMKQKMRRPKTRKPITPIPLTPVIKSVLQGQEDPNPQPHSEQPSRNWLKRRSEKGLSLVRLMATLATGQIKNVIQWASLPPQVLEATRTVQKMEVTGVREAKRRQYRLVEGLIRHCRLDVLEYVIYCVRLGKTVALQRFVAEQASQRENYVKATSQTWVDALMDNEPALARRIYTLPYDYDREEMRRLLRLFKTKVDIARQSKKQESEQLQKTKRRSCVKAKKMLTKFMASLAHKDYSTKCLEGEFTRPLEIESGEAAALALAEGAQPDEAVMEFSEDDLEDDQDEEGSSGEETAACEVEEDSGTSSGSGSPNDDDDDD